jgi:hypothetical protein
MIPVELVCLATIHSLFPELDHESKSGGGRALTQSNSLFKIGRRVFANRNRE